MKKTAIGFITAAFISFSGMALASEKLRSDPKSIFENGPVFASEGQGFKFKITSKDGSNVSGEVVSGSFDGVYLFWKWKEMERKIVPYCHACGTGAFDANKYKSIWPLQLNEPAVIKGKISGGDILLNEIVYLGSEVVSTNNGDLETWIIKTMVTDQDQQELFTKLSWYSPDLKWTYKSITSLKGVVLSSAEME